MTEKTFSSATGTATFKDGIMTVRYHHTIQTVDEAKIWTADFNREFAEILPVVMLINISKHKSFPKDVRDYMNSPEIISSMKAAAMVADSIMTRILGNIFMSISKPPMPTKLFPDEATAIAWLQQFVENKN
jgi:hypothetical protein